MSTLNPGDLSVFVTSVGSEVNPGVGNELTITPTANCRSELINLSFQFAADANAVNRFIYIEHHHNSVVNRIAALQLKIVANDTKHIICNQQSFTDISSALETMVMPIPHYPFIFEGDTLVVKVTGIQVGDAITSIYRAWKLWIYEQ